MATGGSDETFAFTCTPCCKDGNQVEASVYCEVCRECLCVVCYKYHQRSSSMAAHKVLDNAAMQAGGTANIPPLPTDTCDTHSGKPIVLHCIDHDTLYCVECASLDHIYCSTVYIPGVSTSFRDSPQLKKQTESTNNLVVTLDKMKATKENKLQELQQDKNKSLTDVQIVTRNLIRRIRELERSSIDLIKQTYDSVEATLEKEIKYLESLKSDTMSVFAGLASTVKSEAQLYINEIRARWYNLDKRQELGVNVSQKDNLSKFVFLTNPDINKIIDWLNELENIGETTKIYLANLKGDYRVKVATDMTVCDTSGACQLPDGTVLIADYRNKRIKRLDEFYNVTEHCYMDSGAFSITCLASDKIAVTLPGEKKVQFVTVRGSMSLSRSFLTSDCCRGILYSGGQLYVACGGATTKGREEGPGHVSVYSLEGVQLKQIQTDLTGQHIFRCPYHITASRDGDKVLVAQDMGGVVVLDKNGAHVDTITDNSLKHAWGLCTLDNGHVLVCGRDSNNVLQFDGHGSNVTELLKDTDGIKCPRALCYDNRNSRLIVTMQATDNIKVFDLK